jgi:hypothetical protein
MRSAVKFHSFHRRHCLIGNAAPLRARPVILHSILKTRWLARLDVTFFGRARIPGYCAAPQEGLGFLPIRKLAVRLIAALMFDLPFSGCGAPASD